MPRNLHRLDLRRPPSATHVKAYKRLPTALYRAYDLGGRLLYVGISVDVVERMIGHRRADDPCWYWDVYGMDVELWSHWNRAKMAEEQAILTEWPLWNVMQSPWAMIAASRRGVARRVRHKDQHISRVQGLARVAVFHARERGVIDRP